MIGITIVLMVLIIIIAVLIIHANNKHSGGGGGGGGVQEFSEMGGGLPKMGGLFLKWGGLNPSTNLMSNLVIEVALSEFFLLLTLKNFLALTI